MFKVKVLSQGRCKERWLASALQEYEKRLSHQLQIEWVLTEDLVSVCAKEPLLIALDLKGEMLSSEAFSKKLGKLLIEGGSRLSFVIGGSEGIPDPILKKAHWIWSLSCLTFTHQIVRLLLLEQVYRALEIQKGSQYHK